MILDSNGDCYIDFFMQMSTSTITTAKIQTH